jgi:hypothetical protein
MLDRNFRRSVLLSLFAAALLLPLSAPAQQVRVGSSGSDSLSRVVPRMPLKQARFGMTTENGAASLLLTDHAIVLQLTDQELDRIGSAEAEKQEGQGALARMFESMVRGSVRVLLNHGIEYPLSDLADARYVDGRLFFVRNNGERIFEDVRINDSSMMEGFRPREARAFVARFREAKAQGTL